MRTSHNMGPATATATSSNADTDRAPSQYSNALLLHLAYPVTEEDTRKALEYLHLRRHPKLAETWQRSYSNKMGSL